MTAIVQGRGLRKSYAAGAVKRGVLRNVDLDIRAGEFVAIVGPSGCGKTTLLNCLSGLDDLDAGQVRVEGVDLGAVPDRTRTRLRAKRMGFVFQSFNLLPVLSAVQNVELPLLLLGVPRSAARPKALQALAAVGLRERAESRPAQLSGGQQQRVAIARAIVNRPAIVWADEPTGNLDSENAKAVLDLLLDLNRRHGVTLCVVTHDARVAQAAHRILRMDSGRIVETKARLVVARGRA